jgi:uncharacterized membrane protein
VELFIDIIQCVVAAFIGYSLGKPKKLPYRWECMGEGCTFKVATTRSDFTIKMADNHMEAFHPNGY